MDSATKSASAGYLARRCSARSLGCRAVTRNGDRAYGPLTDQVALYGVLAQLRALGGLELLELRCTRSPDKDEGADVTTTEIVAAALGATRNLRRHRQR